MNGTSLMKHPQAARRGRAVIASLAALAALLLGLFAVPGLHPAFAGGPYTVDSTTDAHCLGFVSQTAPGCTSITYDGNHISLRSALEYASTSGGATIIDLPPGTYNLTLGDLIAGTRPNTAITLHGQATAANTTLHQTQAHRLLINIDANLMPAVQFTLENVTLSGGNEDNTDPNGFGGDGGAILAGGSATATGNSLTIHNVVFTGNTTTGNADGGAIAMTGGGDLTVSGSEFDHNQAGVGGNGSGGAIYYDNRANPGAVSISQTLFRLNQAYGTGGGQGGALYLAGGAGASFSLTLNTFTGNQAAQEGGAIYLSKGSLVGKANTISGNTAVANASGGIYVANNAGSTADMRENWWGCNSGPGTPGCDGAFPAVSSPLPLSAGQIAFEPWLRHLALPMIFKN